MLQESQKALIEPLKKNVLFKDLSEDQLFEFVPLISAAFYDAGDTIIEEGETAKGLYIIKKGSVEVIKHGKDATLMRLTTLHANECFGEMTMIDHSPRSATIRAVVPTEVVYLSLDDLDEFRATGAAAYTIILTNLATELNERLRATSDVTVTAIQGQKNQTKTSEALTLELSKEKISNKLATCFAYATGLLAVYSLLVILTVNLTTTYSMVIGFTFPMTIIFCYLLIYITKKNLGHGSSIGLSTKNISQSLTESLLITIPIILFVTLAKWLLILLVPSFSQMSTFNILTTNEIALYGFNSLAVFLITLLITYGLLAFFQELFARGVMLTSLEKIVQSRYAKTIAVFLSSVIFLIIYTHGSIYTISVMLIPNIIWSFLYLRHRTLIGVTISHAIVGIWAFYLLGIDSMVQFVINIQG